MSNRGMPGQTSVKYVYAYDPYTYNVYYIWYAYMPSRAAAERNKIKSEKNMIIAHSWYAIFIYYLNPDL